MTRRAFTQVELLGYLEHCREQVSRMRGSITQDVAARPLPPAHRHHRRPYGVLVGSVPLHVIEHAAQIRQFLTATGIHVQPVPDDRHYIR